MTEEEKGKQKASYLIRLIGGVYLLYLVWGLAGDLRNGVVEHTALILFAAVLFALIGVLFLVTSIRYLLKERKK